MRSAVGLNGAGRVNAGEETGGLKTMVQCKVWRMMMMIVSSFLLFALFLSREDRHYAPHLPVDIR